MNLSLGIHAEIKAEKLSSWRGINSVSAYVRFLIAEDHKKFENSKDSYKETVAEILLASKNRG